MSHRQARNHPWRNRHTNHADFEFHVCYLEERRLLLIVDLDLGSKSVTNDMRFVLDRVEQQTVGKLEDYEILYRDSTGSWDRVDPRTPLCISAGPRDGSIERVWKLVTRT
jgi:hypothetical protein